MVTRKQTSWGGREVFYIALTTISDELWWRHDLVGLRLQVLQRGVVHASARDGKQGYMTGARGTKLLGDMYRQGGYKAGGLAPSEK